MSATFFGGEVKQHDRGTAAGSGGDEPFQARKPWWADLEEAPESRPGWRAGCTC